jgi:hypothetical protein
MAHIFAPKKGLHDSAGFSPISANLIKARRGECISSQRDSMIVAWHEVPGKSV